MKLLTILAILTTFSATAVSQEFTTPDAIAAKKKYETQLSELRKQYSAELAAASIVADRNGASEEVARIKQIRLSLTRRSGDDAVAGGRGQLEHSRWTFERVPILKSRGDHIYEFKPESDVVILPQKATVKWYMLDPHLVMVRTGPTVFFLQFDQKYSTFRVDGAFAKTKSSWGGGKRLK